MARPRIVIPLLAGLILLLAASSVPAQQNGPMFETMAARNVVQWTKPLMPQFEKAAAKRDIPLPLLLTLGYIGSHFENRGDAPTIEGGYGVMALRGNNMWGSDSLGEGSNLIANHADKVKIDPHDNINAAAAVLDRYARQMDIDRGKGLEAWLEPVIKYAGLDAEFSRMFAMQVYEKLLTGLDYVNSEGERFHFEPQDIGNIDIGALRPKSARPARDASSVVANGDASIMTAQYGPAIWYGAASCNYTATSTSKDTVVIHTIEGSAAGCLSWMNNCNADVSSHYVVSEAGTVWQMVDEWYRAWHAGCVNSRALGIENEGYAGSASHPQSLYNACGLLVRDMCNSWGIVKEHRGCPPGICGHGDVNNCVCGGTHWDPGGGWDWGYFIGVVQGAPPPPTYAAAYISQSYPSTMVAGSTAVVWVECRNDGTATWSHSGTRLGTQQPQDRSSAFFTPGNWIGANRPTDVDQSTVSTGQVGRFTFVMTAPSTPGVYTEHWQLVQEGVTWFGPDIWFQITVTPATGSINGNVKNSAGANLAGATVSIAGGGSTTTDGNGNYSFGGLNAGSYTLTASKSGYNNSSAPVNVTAGSTATQNFTLTPTDQQAPTVPANLSAVPVLPTQINLTWSGSTDNVGVAGYRIYRGGAYLTSVTTTSYSDAGLASNTAYTYTVSAYDAVGNASAQSAPASATTPPSEIIIDNGACTFTGSWSTATASADKYGADYRYASSANSTNRTAIWRPNMPAGGTCDVYCWYSVGTNRATNSPYTVYWSGGSQTVNVNQQVNGGQWILLVADKPFAAGTSGYVRLGNGTGSTGKIVVADAVRFVVKTVDAVPPSVPSGLSANPVSMTQVNLAWNAATDNIGVAGYNVYRDGALLTSTADLSYADANCSQGTTYSYEVAAYDAAGNESAKCAAVQATTPGDEQAPSAPANLVATAASQTQVDLVWTASTDNMGVAGYKVYRDGAQIATSPTASYSDASCTRGTTYIYEVSAYDAAGNESAKSNTAEVHTPGDDVEAPSIPANLAATAVSGTEINVTWTTSTDNIGVTGYKVFRNGTQIGVSATASFADTGLTPATTYTYSVSAYDAAGNDSQQSEPASAATFDTIAPDVPTNLAATAISGTQIDLSWDASTDNVGVTGYRIFRGGAQVGTSATTSYSDTGLTPATAYTYTVSAFDASDNESALSASAGATTLDTVAPSVPGGLTASAVSGSQINLAWTASTDNVGVTGYKVFRDGSQIGTSATASYSDTNCASYTAYAYTVLAYDAAANESAQSSPASATTWDTTPPSVPANLSATPISSSRIDLAWDASTDNAGVTGYKVYRDGVQIGTSPTTDFSDTTCAPGNVYSYQVSAYDARGNESAKSIADEASTLDTTPPTAPADLAAAVVSQTQIDLTWSASTDNVGVTGYKVFRDGSQIGVTATTSYSDTTCQSYTTYAYTVSAYDAAGNDSALSSPAGATTQPFTDIVVDNPAASYVGAWFTGTASGDKYGADYSYCSTAAGETKTATFTPKIDIPGYYTVYVWYPQGANRSTMAPFTVVWDGGQQTVNVNQQTGGGQWVALVTNKKFAAGTAGYIRLGNGTGEASLNVMADAVRVLLISDDVTAPSVPANVAASGASATSVNVTWTASTDNVGVAGYTIFRDGVAVGTSATASYMDTGLAQMTTYTYTVTAYDAMGNESAGSAPANGTTWDGTAPSVPAGLTATAATPTRVNLAWSASTDNVGVTGYKVYRGGAYVTTVAGTTYTDTGRSPGSAYSYTVSAIDERNNESAQSTAAGATTPAFADIVIDNPAATYTGVWSTATSSADKYGADYRYASTAVNEGKTATWRPTIAYPGNYNVYVWYPVGTNRATNSPFFTQWDGGNATTAVNQTVTGGQWVLIQSSKHFAAGTAGYVKLGNGTGATGKIVVADAVRFQQVSGD